MQMTQQFCWRSIILKELSALGGLESIRFPAIQLPERFFWSQIDSPLLLIPLVFQDENGLTHCDGLGMITCAIDFEDVHHLWALGL
jgi:hypothetical protein